MLELGLEHRDLTLGIKVGLSGKLSELCGEV
jgi:hypothetical protein